jgi:hypothetical protein
MPIVPLRELFTGPQTGGGPSDPGTTGGSGTQMGPLGWNLARRKPRANWRSGFAGPGVGTSVAGPSAMIVQARASVRPRTGRGGIYAAFPPASAVPPSPLRGLSVGIRKRPTAGRVWIPEFTARLPQPPPLPSVRPVAVRPRWRPGRSAFRGLPAAVAPTPPLVPVAVARPSHRGSPGFASPLRFPTGIARPLSLPPRSTMTPTARLGNAPRPAGRTWPVQYPCLVLPSPLLPGAKAVRRRGDDMARRRPGRLFLCRPIGLAFSGELHYNIYVNSGSGDTVNYAGPGVSASGRRM